MDLKARHITKIDIPNCRYVTFKDDKAYVSAYVGSVADADMLGSVFEIDTATLAITREIKVGHQPDSRKVSPFDKMGERTCQIIINDRQRLLRTVRAEYSGATGKSRNACSLSSKETAGS